MYYYLIIALQAFCIYHLFKNRNEYYWIFLIIFLPVVGSLIYIIMQVYNKREAEKVTNEIVTLINPTKRVKDLEKKLLFAETFQNQVNLADAYFEIEDYHNAIKFYEPSLTGGHQNDFFVIKSLVASYYNTNNYDQVISFSEKIKEHAEFKKSNTQFLYALALEKLGRDDEAEEQLKAIDQRYSNYEERLVLANFLIAKDKVEDAKVILNDINEESKHMTKLNKRKYRDTFLLAEKLLMEI